MSKSPFFVERKPLTRADELRDQLSELEAKVGRLGYGLGQDALTIPRLFDAISEGLASFRAQGQSMRAEEARLGAVSADFKRKVRAFVREIGGIGTLREARRAHRPDPASWWWFLDQFLAAKRRANLRRLATLMAGGLVVLLLLFFLYQRFLAPDPATRERLRHQQAAENLALAGDLAGALSEVEQALTLAPDDPYLLILKGSMQRGLGQEEAARETFAAAETMVADQESFLITRGQAFLLSDQVQASLVDAQAAIEANPVSAAGYMLLGRAYERLENYQEAIFAYQQAATLADEQGKYQLSATARMSMAILMQRAPAQ